MKREIKFRAWDELNKMYFGSLLQDRWYSKTGFLDVSMGGLEGCVIMQATGLKDKAGKEAYENDIVEVCVFLVSPSNPDNDQHFRGEIIFGNGCWQFKISKYLKFGDKKNEWVNLKVNHLPFSDVELDEDGTFTIPIYDFIGISGNLGEMDTELIEVVGDIYQKPELLTPSSCQ